MKLRATFVHLAALLIFSAVLLLRSAPTEAADRFDDEQSEAYEGVKSGRIKPLSQVLKAAKRKVKGRVTGVSLIHRGGNSLYRVRILKSNGKLVSVYINASTRSAKRRRKGRRTSRRSRDDDDDNSGRGRRSRSDDDDDDDDRGSRRGGRSRPDRDDDDDRLGGRDEDSDRGGRGRHRGRRGR